MGELGRLDPARVKEMFDEINAKCERLTAQNAELLEAVKDAIEQMEWAKEILLWLRDDNHRLIDTSKQKAALRKAGD